MPLLSIVVPVYDVVAYLRTCLDSILDQSFTDFELIVVDDDSPDHCGEIIDEYAERDERVRPIHLSRNIGLGPARNAGFAQATGEYVWFVDSDDWLAEGALAAVADRLRQTRPDVLVVDYARAYWHGRVRRNRMSRLLDQNQAPETFRIEEHPELLKVFPCAWNKVVRRELLAQADLPFTPGWYEDLPFTFPLFALADRISLLDRVCVLYRQRRNGGILRTGDTRHFAVLDQYRLVFQRLDRIGPKAQLVRDYVVAFSIEHGLVILRNPARVPKSHRAEFFHLLARFRREHAPRGYQLPPGPAGVRHRMVAKDAWITYSAARVARIVYGRSRTFTRRQLRRGRRVRKLATAATLRGMYALARRLPLRDVAVYGSYWGRAYRCGPAAICDKVRELAPHVRNVWVVGADQAAELPPGVEHVIPGTWRYYRTLARARWAINNVNFGDEVIKRPGTVHVQTHHGTALKYMGVDEPGWAKSHNDPGFRKLLRRCDRWDFSVVANRYSTEVWARAYPCGFESLEYGSPRNDVLVNASADDVEKLRVSLGLEQDQLVILYAPTHREYGTGLPPVPDLDALAAAAGPDARVLMRAHYFHDWHRPRGLGPAVLDVSRHPSVEELYLVSDVLVTDYSSAMFDYGVLDRPIVVYAPDWETYRLIRGTYFDLLAAPPGVVARTEEQLLEAFRGGSVWDEAATAARARFRQRFCRLDDGRAAERVVRRVFLGETVDEPAEGAMRWR